MRAQLLGFVVGMLIVGGYEYVNHYFSLQYRYEHHLRPSALLVKKETLPNATIRTEHGDEKDINKVKKRIKVLCWIPSRTSSGSLLDRIISTWAETCDFLLFTSTFANPKLNVVKIDYPLDQSLWNMIHPAWTYIEEHHLEEFDWFVKLDDDTYFSGDNFKALVQDKDPNQLFYLGHTAVHSRKPLDDPRSSFNLGAGHALSRESLRRLGPFLPNSKKPLPNGYTSRCDREISWAEDVVLSECLWVAGVGGPNNTRDAWGRENFLSFPPTDNFVTVRRPDSSSWFWRGKPKWVGSGARCCSSRPILWHGMKSSRSGSFYYIQYFLYDLMVDPLPDVRLTYSAENVLR